MASYLNQPRSLKQRRWFGSLSSHVAGYVFILDTVFEVGAPLKWMPPNQSLGHALALQKRQKPQTGQPYITIPTCDAHAALTAGGGP